ncbi:MAG: hypothetical protein K8T25_01210 [Planctomycetia bacterium]|nr:hypothetical protein [Planctomycetia bacterium]
MRFLLILATVALAVICWGVYGPVLHNGQVGFHADSQVKPTPEENRANTLRAFMCVGLAYFVIAVIVPSSTLQFYGEQGHWTMSGTLWSLIAGAAGAIGALGVIFALQFASAGFKGNPTLYVMPLVFGGAPVVNAVLTIAMAKAFRQVGPMFLAGLIMVLLGSLAVLISTDAAGFLNGLKQLPGLLKVLAAVGVVILAWGVYGPVLHKGQVAMQSSRLRPLICVGLSYFAIAVIVPGVMLSGSTAGQWTTPGALWSLGAGAAGALGALGIILCFNYGGKPMYVMPLVFGGAPVVNTLVTTVGNHGFDQLRPLFYAGLILVCSGAAIVLFFAPRGHAPAPIKPVTGKPSTTPAR